MQRAYVSVSGVTKTEFFLKITLFLNLKKRKACHRIHTRAFSVRRVEEEIK